MQRNTSNTEGIWRLTGALREPLPRSYRYIRRRRRYYWVKASYPVFPNSSPIGAEANKLIKPYVEKQLKEVVLPDDCKPDPLEGLPHFMQMVNTVSICRRGLLSMYFETILYTGGANEWESLYTINLALRDGELQYLFFYDLVRSFEDAEFIVRRHLEPRVYEAVRRRERRSSRSAVNTPRVQLASRNLAPVSKFLYGYDLDSFVLTPTAIMWVIPPGRVDAYAFGTYLIKVPYAEIRHMLAFQLD